MICSIRPCQRILNLRNSFKNFEYSLGTLSAPHVSDRMCVEVTIPVPWGHVAGKLWGNPDVQPVLAIHGVQDNAATFDRLAPLLEVEAALALDLPGHGRSSHLPAGLPYHFFDAVTFVRFIIHHHYQWTQPVVLVGHSFGSFLSLVYSCIFPNEVNQFISIDCSRHHMTESPGTTIPHTRDTIEKMLQLEKKSPPQYTYDELLEKFHSSRKRLLTRESSEVLLSRGVTRSGSGKIHLSRDPRLNMNAFGRLTTGDLLSLVENIRAPTLSIQAQNGTVKGNLKGDLYRKTIEIIQSKSPDSKHLVMPGNHHLHLDDPRPVADVVNEFLPS